MKKLLLFALLMLCVSAFAQKQYTLQSPNGKITVTVSEEEIVEVGTERSEYWLYYSIKHEETVVLDMSEIAMQIDNGKTLGISSKPSITSVKTKSVNQTVEAPFYKRAEIQDQYNELTLSFKGNYKVIFRAYNEGVAYRFQTDFKKPFKVIDETVAFHFDEDYTAWIPYVNARKGDGNFIQQQFYNSFENTYTVTPLSKMEYDRLAFLPLLIELKDGKKAVITEADLEDYPGMYLRNSLPSQKLHAVHAGYPKTREQGGHNNLQWVVKERENYIAKVEGKRSFPWRCIVISENDKDLADSDLVYLLASPSRVEDVSWIQPGKVAWDWWNDWNITGVDFKAGINTQTYKYYIDFASRNGIEYVVLDEGWSAPLDILKVNGDIDLRELVRYAASKKVDLVLWAVSYVLDNNLERACEIYSKMGIKGFKVDFMNRDDQEVTEQLYRIASTAARYHMLIDYHGMYKPAGMNRTWPNVINFEGVWGLEQMKWSKDDMVVYDVTFPFIRMLSGPVDYTQGAMRNAVKSEYVPYNSNPMSQGTRARQVAEYIVFDSPLVMLCDNPTAYMKEQETVDFITDIPTVWDETRILQGALGKFIVTARRSGDKWYVGGMTDWSERDLSLDLSNLIKGQHNAVLYRDGINAARNGTDYRIEPVEIQSKKPFLVHMAPGGGFVLVIE